MIDSILASFVWLLMPLGRFFRYQPTEARGLRHSHVVRFHLHHSILAAGTHHDIVTKSGTFLYVQSIYRIRSLSSSSGSLSSHKKQMVTPRSPIQSCIPWGKTLKARRLSWSHRKTRICRDFSCWYKRNPFPYSVRYCEKGRSRPNAIISSQKKKLQRLL